MSEYEGWAVALYAPCPTCKGTGKGPPTLAGQGQVDQSSLAVLAHGTPAGMQPCPDCKHHHPPGYVTEPKMVTLADLTLAIRTEIARAPRAENERA